MITKLGKLSKVTFGYGGYQDAMLGLSVAIEGDGWGVGDFKGWWSLDIECTEHCEWTEEDRSTEYDKVCRLINKLMKDAKVRSVDKLTGVPVEATFDGMQLKEWRILTEVI